jgi:IS605 OrfB family transposase
VRVAAAQAGVEANASVVTRAVTHIPLGEANAGKLEALDALAAEYVRVCQIYARRFCVEEEPNGFAALVETTRLSDRWHRCAMQQAAGIARSWRSNRGRRHEEFLERLGRFEQHERAGTLWPARRRPEWREPALPTLRAVVLRANANTVAEVPEHRVAKLEAAEGTTFDFWLRISTLERGRPLLVPVRLSDYHRQALRDLPRNSSVELARRDGKWWLTVTVEERIESTTNALGDGSEEVGVDVGIANFVTASDGRQYGTMRGELAERHKKDRAKRERKAKLRGCLKRKGVERLPSVENKRLGRHVRQEINRAVNELLRDHAGMILVIEMLSVASMRMRARAMNAYLYASNLAHVLKQLKWKAALAGQHVVEVPSAYTSQECRICHHTARDNRPDQRTFRCKVCEHSGHADVEAALTILSRKADDEVRRAVSREAVKAILDRRHREWLVQTVPRSGSARPVARPEQGRGSTGVG